MSLIIPKASWGVPRIRCLPAKAEGGLYPIGSAYRTDCSHNTSSQEKVLPCLAANNMWRQFPCSFGEEVKHEQFKPEAARHPSAWCWKLYISESVTAPETWRQTRAIEDLRGTLNLKRGQNYWPIYLSTFLVKISKCKVRVK
jgi:hypothetical protein